ncbi:serine protease [Candidatus Woesearchaeota archaeon]|nr:serine protease [Candidatus Woesearchaeota archaeon]
MPRKLFKLITGKRERTKQLVATLDDFLTNAKNNSLTSEQAKKNLNEGIIELIENEQHSSNGLLITDNGYFLTARHCVKGSLPLQIVLYDGMKCRVEKICAQGNIQWIDVALVKADVPGNAVSRSYRLQTNDVDVDAYSLPITLFTRWDEKLVKKDGFIIPSLRYKDSFISSIPAIHGDSGGIVANQTYQLIGILRGYLDPHTSASLFLPRALDLIHFYKRCLESRL